MPTQLVDDVEMPKYKSQRANKYDEMKKKYFNAIQRLNKDTPYRPRDSYWETIKDIWNQN